MNSRTVKYQRILTAADLRHLDEKNPALIFRYTQWEAASLWSGIRPTGQEWSHRDFHKSINSLLRFGIRRSQITCYQRRRGTKQGTIMPNSTACLNPTHWLHLCKNKYKRFWTNTFGWGISQATSCWKNTLEKKKIVLWRPVLTPFPRHLLLTIQESTGLTQHLVSL